MINKKKAEKYIGEYIKKHYKKRSQLKAGSVALSVLHGVAEGAKTIGELLEMFASSDFNKMFRYPTLYPEARGKKYLSSSQLTGGVSNLERGGYVKKERVEGKQTVCLTEKGIREILKYKMKNKHSEKPWDEKWRIVIFDIEEITRKDRDYLRDQLKYIGFQELQKSVWIFPYEIREELKEFIKLCKFEFQGDVRFILADKIDPDLLLRKKFDLNKNLI